MLMSLRAYSPPEVRPSNFELSSQISSRARYCMVHRLGHQIIARDDDVPTAR
jgi:hypothetical protein